MSDDEHWSRKAEARAQGFRPDRICEPVVRQMGSMLEEDEIPSPRDSNAPQLEVPR